MIHPEYSLKLQHNRFNAVETLGATLKITNCAVFFNPCLESARFYYQLEICKYPTKAIELIIAA